MKPLLSVVREVCALKSGLRKAVVVPSRLMEAVREFQGGLGLRLAPLFFIMPDVEVALLTEDYELVGRLYARLFTDGKSENVDRLLGELCGFPRCCIEKYMESPAEERIVEAYRRYRRQVEKLGEDPINLGAWEDDEGWVWLHPVSHVPCSPSCRETRLLLERLEEMCGSCKEKPCLETTPH